MKPASAFAAIALLLPPGAHAASYAIDLSVFAYLGQAFVPFTGELPTFDILRADGPAAGEATFDPGDPGSLSLAEATGRLSLSGGPYRRSDAAVAGVAVDADLRPFPPGDESFVQPVRFGYAGELSLTSEDGGTWAGAGLRVSFLDAESGATLRKIDRNGSDDPTGWTTSEAQFTASNIVSCGLDVSTAVGATQVMELLVAGPISVAFGMDGATGVADCGDDPFIYLPPAPNILGAAVVGQGEGFAPVPAPPAALLLATALCAAALRAAGGRARV